MEISQKCVNISEMILVKIDSRKVYENLEFDEEQERHRSSIQKRLRQLHDEIVSTMKRTYEVFKADGTEVWGDFCSSFQASTQSDQSLHSALSG